jgi:hypothetical protein
MRQGRRCGGIILLLQRQRFQSSRWDIWSRGSGRDNQCAAAAQRNRLRCASGAEFVMTQRPIGWSASDEVAEVLPQGDRDRRVGGLHRTVHVGARCGAADRCDDLLPGILPACRRRPRGPPACHGAHAGARGRRLRAGVRTRRGRPCHSTRARHP